MPIAGIQLAQEVGSVLGSEPKNKAVAGFGEHLKNFLADTNNKMIEAENMTRAFAVGETNNLHETMIAVEQAGIAFKLASTIRNRVLEAYNDVMRMSV